MDDTEVLVHTIMFSYFLMVLEKTFTSIKNKITNNKLQK